MRVVNLGVLHRFLDDHGDCRTWADNWVQDVRASAWRHPQDIKDRYRSASFLADRVVIFNVRGNRYRLQVQVVYHTQIVLVQWIGTHAEYTRRSRRGEP